MVKCPHYFLHTTENITKKQMDMVIDKVNNRLNIENSKWYMRYDGNSVDTKYWVSYEVKRNGEALGQEPQDIFFSLRISSFQYKDKYIDINNKLNLIKDAPDDSYILTKNGNYNNRKRDGLNLYLYSKNVNMDDIKHLLDIFNNELNKVGASIIMKIRESNNLVDFNDIH